ncbi:MAG: translocase [Bryobacterales bacterium]|nr:translocase [Bryobacterales bacterium]
MTNADVLAGRNPRRTWLDRFLSIFSTVHAGEGLTAVLLAANVFVLMGTYYILKTVREPLILNQPGGAEVKAYSSAGLAMLFLLIMPAYSAFASRVNRLWLISGVTALFIANLVLFSALGAAGVKIGVAYYLWVGIFNMLFVAQFWAFANDIYTEEQGKRLFPIVGVGGSIGAVVGSLATKEMFEYIGPFQMMLLSAVSLGICIVLTWIIHVREKGRVDADRAKQVDKPLDKKGGFALIISRRYLALIAALVFLLNCVNSVGEYVLSAFVRTAAQALPAAEQGKFMGQFYGDYFTWVNLISLIVQSFLVARLFKWIGVRGALFILPLISLTGYGLLATIPILALVRSVKILENATDYSLNNTVRAALFLPTSREEKYKGKATIDTFFARAGDMLQAGFVFVGTQLALGVTGMATINIVLVSIWLAVCVGIYKEHKRLTAEK